MTRVDGENARRRLFVSPISPEGNDGARPHLASAFIDDDVARVVTTRSRDDEGTRATRGPAREGENTRGDDERRERFVSFGTDRSIGFEQTSNETRHDGRDAHARVHADVRDDERITVRVVSPTSSATSDREAAERLADTMGRVALRHAGGDDETRDGENAGKRRGEDADVRVRGRGLCGVSESAGSVEA